MKLLLDLVLGFGLIMAPTSADLAAQVAPRVGREPASPEPDTDRESTEGWR